MGPRRRPGSQRLVLLNAHLHEGKAGALFKSLAQQTPRGRHVCCRKELGAAGCSQRVNPTIFHSFLGFFFSRVKSTFGCWLRCRGIDTLSFSMCWTFQVTSASNIAPVSNCFRPTSYWYRPSRSTGAANGKKRLGRKESTLLCHSQN